MGMIDICCIACENWLTYWAATLIGTDLEPPFLDHNDLYHTIDSTPVGDIAWESFKLKYNRELPDDDIPAWMEAKHKVWFRDPRLLIHNILTNADFNSEIDISPFQEYDVDDNHQYQNFMSGNWA
jgi:hypothetical protein